MSCRIHSVILGLACASLFFTSSRLVAYETPPAEPGFVSLFDGKNIEEHFVIKGDRAQWRVEDGVIVSYPGGDRLMSKEVYSDFVLRLDWKVGKNGNSGVFIRVPSQEDRAPWTTGFEVQISNAYRDNYHYTGSVYGVAPVNPRPDATADEWHSFEIMCLRTYVRVKVDGTVCVEMSYDDPNYAAAMRSRGLAGYIGLQDSHVGKEHKDLTISYRNIRIQRLTADGVAEGFEPLTTKSQGWRKIETGHGSGGRWRHSGRIWSGEQDPPGSGNGGVLLSERRFQDFEVIFETYPDWGVCSGFFLRSTEKGACYQIMIDHHGRGNIGGLYGEGTGGFNVRSYNLQPDRTIVPAPPESAGAIALPFPASQFGRYWDFQGFNEIRARCVGNPPTIEVWLNGAYVTRFKDDQVRLEEPGGLGLQVHGGNGWPEGAKVRFRNVQVRELR